MFSLLLLKKETKKEGNTKIKGAEIRPHHTVDMSYSANGEFSPLRSFMSTPSLPQESFRFGAVIGSLSFSFFLCASIIKMEMTQHVTQLAVSS